MEETSGSFETTIPEDHLELLLDLCASVGVDPLGSLDGEKYFTELIQRYSGPPDGLADWLQHELASSFCRIKESPSWIQGADWQFCDGRPMVFVGQIPIPRESGFLHDDGMCYVFWAPRSGSTRTVIQVG